MQRFASGIALAVVAAVALAAAVDAVREAVEPEPARAEPRPRFIDSLTLLTGRLLWTDARCRLHVTSVATLQEPRRPRRVPCTARLGPSGRLIERGAPGRRLVSPSGELVARATARGLVVVKDGTPRLLPIRAPAALAWSPDERWLAAAGEKEVYVVRILNRDMRIRRLPIAATQLAWVRAGCCRASAAGAARASRER
jgi:hypothetical protein